jgi:hypothetical protein
MLRREPPVFGSGALAQIFGSKSRGTRGIVVPQCALSVRVSYFLSDLVPRLAGPFFLQPGHIREGLNFTALRSVGLRPPGKTLVEHLRAILPTTRVFPAAPLSAARKMGSPRQARIIEAEAWTRQGWSGRCR